MRVHEGSGLYANLSLNLSISRYRDRAAPVLRLTNIQASRFQSTEVGNDNNAQGVEEGMGVSAAGMIEVAGSLHAISLALECQYNVGQRGKTLKRHLAYCESSTTCPVRLLYRISWD